MGLTNKEQNIINSPMYSQAYKDKLKAEAEKKASAVKARVDYAKAKGQVDKLKKDAPKKNDKPLISGTSFENSKGDLIPLESAEKQKEREEKRNIDTVKSNPGRFSFDSDSSDISDNDVLRLGKGPLSEREQINQGVYNNKSQKDEKTLAKLSLSLSNAANNKSSDPVALERQFREFKKYLDDYRKDYGKLPAGYDSLYASVEKIISDYEKARSGHSISAGGEFKKENFGSWLLKNAAAGLASFNQAFGATLDFITPTDFLGDKDPFGKINEYYNSENEKYSRKALNSSLAMGDGYENAGKLLQATVNALPQAVLAVLSGGSSVASSLGSSGGMISNFVTSAAKNPSFWLSAFQTMGNEYERAKALGANDFVASSAAIISSLLNAGVEVSGGIETLLPGLKNGNASTVRQWVRSMVEEGGEEAVQSIIQKSISKIMYDKDIENISLTDENAVVSGKGMLGDFIGGAVVGGFLGGGTIGADYVANAISDIRGPRFESFVKNDAFYHVKNARKFLRRDLIAMDTVARNFGVKIEIVDSLYDEHGDFANGQFSADGKTLYISKESKDPLTLTFIHESVHALKANDPEAYKAILEDLKKTVGTNTKEYRDVISALRSSYRKHLNGTKLQNKNLIDEEFTAATLSHLLANPKSLKFIAQSDMNRLSRIADNVFSLFDGNIRRFKNAEGDAAKLFEPVVKRIETKRKQFEKAYVEAGGEVQGTLSSFNGKYSIVSLPNGMKYVKANEQVIKSSDPELWEQEIIDYVNKTVRKGQDVEFFLDDGDILKITGRTAWKLGDKGSLSDELYFVKGNASGVIDEIVQVSSYKKSKPPLKKHRNGFAKKGFDYRRAFFEDLDGSYYRLSISVGINEDGKEVYNIGRIEKEDHIPRKRLNGLNMGNRSSDNRISDNNDIVKSKNSLPLDNNSTQVNTRVISDIIRRSSIRYGLGDVDSEAVKTISFAQKDIDERKGWNFRFEDNTVRGQVQDKHNNSLHLSDSVIYEMNDSGNISYGTGRIIDFLPAEADYDFNNYQNSDVSEGSKYDAIVAIDSGVGFTDTIRVPGRNLMFVAHNTAETVSNDFTTADIMYSRAKNAFDALGRSGDINALKAFSFADAQYYLLHSSQKMNMLARKIRRDMARDEGITDEHYSVMHSEGSDSNPFDYAFQSPYDMTMELYDAVRNYNLAKDICDIYIATGASVVDYNKLAASLQDIDAILPYKRTRSQRSKNSPNYQKSYVTNNSFANGSYMFNDLERNFERVFGNHYDVVKPLIDNFNRAKGAYARNLMGNVSVLTEMCREYDFEPGDNFDIAIQAYGEGSLHLDLNKSSDMRIFKRMGYNPADYASSDVVDIDFGYDDLVSRFGEVKAEQIKHCAESFRVMYDDYLKRANETIAKIYPGQPDRLIKPRKDYFRHFKDIGDDLFSLGFALSENIQIDPELAGISDRTKPNQSFESYRQMREGKSTGYSAIKGFLEYMQQAEYTIQINPFIKEFRNVRQILAHAKSQQGSDDLNSFLSYLDKFSNHLAKKTIGVDRIFTDFMGKSGRSMLSGISMLNNKAMSNIIVGNLGVSVKQILNLKNGIFYLQNPNLLVNATYGLARAVSNPELMEHYDSLFEQSNYLAERYLDLSFAERKSSARRVAENIVSIGDEFACRAIWLAAYEDGLRLGATDPVIYADDIAKKCSAGRGIGEKPLAFTEQSIKLALSFLLENNNNWNVLRDFFSDTVKQRGSDDHVFGDKNSYKYYKHNKSGEKKFASNAFKLAAYLLATVGINDLLEEMLGFRAEFDVINNFRRGFSDAYRKNGNRFDINMFFDGMLRSAKNTGIDFAQHRNFSQVYAAMLDWVSEDNPLDSNNEFFGSMPVLSIVSNTMKKGIKDRDLLGAGFELGTGLLMPYGGGQVKKTTKGLFDYAQGGHYKTPFTEIIAGKPKGGLSYEVEQSRGNFMRGALFGSSAFPEAREYYDGIDDYYEKKSEDDKLRNKAFDDFVSGFYTRSGKGFEGEISRLLDKSGEDYALPYAFLDKEVIYDDLLGNEQTVTLSEEERKRYNDDLNRKLSDAYKNIVNSDKYKKSDDDGKLSLLKKEHSKISGDFAKRIKNSFRFKSEIDEYVAAHGEDDAVKFYKKEGNIDYLPFYYPDRNQKRSSNNKTYNFELSDEQLGYYSEISQEQIEKEYSMLFESEGWAGLSDEKKSEKLLKAREKAIENVGKFIKNDYIYKDAMKKFDSEHGADNAIRKAYEYSHDATVYPFYELNDKIEFTYKSVGYNYEFSHEKDSYYNTQVEYDTLSKAYNDGLEERYSSYLIPWISSRYYTDDELYELIKAYKKRVMDDRLNVQLRNYAKGKLGLGEHSFQKVK